MIFGPPKTEAGERVLAIPDELVPELEHHLNTYVGAGKDDLLFTSPDGGHPLRRTKFWPRWSAACKTAAVTGLRFHDLRHTALTWAAQDGASTAELMYLAGHKSAATALRYQHAEADRDRQIADRMGARLKPAVADDDAAPAAAVVNLS